MSNQVIQYTNSAMLLDLYSSLKKGLVCSIMRSHSKRDLFLARKQLAYKLPATKGSRLGHKEFEDLYSNKMMLKVTDNITVVAYMNKEGGMVSSPMCALL